MKIFFTRLGATPGIFAGVLGLAPKAIPVALRKVDYACFVAAALPQAASSQRGCALKSNPIELHANPTNNPLKHQTHPRHHKMKGNP